MIAEGTRLAKETVTESYAFKGADQGLPPHFPAE